MYVYGLGAILPGATAVTSPLLSSSRSAPPAPTTQLVTASFAPIAPAVALISAPLTPITTKPMQLTPVTASSLLATAAMKSSGTKPAAGGGYTIDVTGKMVYSTAAKPTTAGSAVPGGAPSDNGGQDPFVAACEQDGGSVAEGICTLPTGEQITLENGEPVCLKAVPNGMYCRGNGATAPVAAKGRGGVALLGVAALAALMFLR